MGREIRRVPMGFEHPLNEYGHPHPMYNQTWSQALADWDDEYQLFQQGLQRNIRTNEPEPLSEHAKDCTFEEWHGDRPDNPDYYFPDWPEGTELGWCLYENVSEGTPCTPIFPSPEGLIEWLTTKGENHGTQYCNVWSMEAAANLVKMGGSVPSMMLSPQTGLRQPHNMGESRGKA